MALVTSAQQVSSADSKRPASNYDVFLNFRGKDTRTTFTDHLYDALVRANIRTFRDEDRLPKGEAINPELVKAIRHSTSSIIVFSKDYASSRSCLDELVTILKEKKASGHIVLPMFYDVVPSDVKNQAGSLDKAFAGHEKLNEWKAALSEAADLAGRVLRDEDRHESRFIKKIVKDMEDKLKNHGLVENVRGIAGQSNAGGEGIARIEFAVSFETVVDKDDVDSTSQSDADGQSDSDSCFKCGSPGHWARDCDSCFKCGSPGHWARDCDSCFKCGSTGHWARDCDAPSGGGGHWASASTDTCYECGKEGHWARDCPAVPSYYASASEGRCFNCGNPGHWSRECPFG